MRTLYVLLGVSALALSACSASDVGQTNDEDEALTNFNQFQKHNLATVNAYRAKKGIAPLKLGAKLSSFAHAGSVELEKDHSPHKHFITAANNGSIWHDGFTSNAGENQGDPHGWPELATDPTANEKAQIDAIQAAMFAEGPGSGEAHGHYENMMNAKFHRLGVGFVETSAGKLYLTNDFSD